MSRLLLLISLVVTCSSVLAAPRVVVSIAPLHSIVADVMQGMNPPELLIPPGRSPHAHALRPSEAKRLAGADVVVWVGSELESFLAKPLTSLAAEALEIRLMDIPGMVLLPYREDEHGVHDPHHDHGAHDDAHDPHVWLSTANAAQTAIHVARTLAEIDPDNATLYQSNAERAVSDYGQLLSKIRAQLEPVSHVPYLVFHDAYQYFEGEVPLTNVGAITLWPELTPGVERISQLRKAVEAKGVRCIFTEPQFPQRLAQALAEGSGARIARIDPLGASLPSGAGGYVALIREFADSLHHCLGATDQPGA